VKLEDGIVYFSGLSMVMFHGDPLMRPVNEIIARVVEAGLYNCWIANSTERMKIFARKKAKIYPLDGYYSFSPYHMQPVFYLLLIGWCLSAFCFMAELLYNCVSNKRI